jgi:hypothetical protein
MNGSRSAVLLTLSCLLAAPLVTQTAMAQTTIGGASCNSAMLSGIYAFSLTGRQVTSAGNFTNVLQGNGSANFDGQSVVNMTLTTGTLQAASTPLSWSGTYTVQANCAGVVTITNGGTAVLNIVLYDQGVDFVVSGNDAIYSYSGSGNNQPTGCSAATLSGVYMFTATGYSLSGSSVNGILDATGLLQFDGVSSITANASLSAIGTTTSGTVLAGSYSISSTCVGSATLTNSKGSSYVMSFSVENVSKVNMTDFLVTLAQSGSVLVSGTGHPVYGQPVTATAADRGSAEHPQGTFEILLSDAAHRRGI